jgi:NitT/TauT family transport system permease protein
MPKSNSVQPQSRLWRLLGVAAFLAVWQLAAALIKSSLILPRPWEAGLALWHVLNGAGFWGAVAGTMLRVLEAFALSLCFGLVSGALSGFYPEVKAFMSPFITGVRATPVLALILLAMFWFPSTQVPVFSAVLMAFPIIYTSTETGAHAADQRLVQMAELFHVPKTTIFWRLRVPSALPYLFSGAKNALGLSWKVVVAGEVLAQPRMALGTGMQDARLSLETPTVFAWAITTILLCGLTEYFFGLLTTKLSAQFQQTQEAPDGRGEQ